ncbi:hypothetical protein CONLIGDRAFT_390808 [Coniochaeta ligniaria NRRL 30616]|uniref:Zn(2)-C6 fungal-type domain-containing protein n=1 Tax=Coniochaeta ligniaria NRRL 30616 TaxID=1408157 RepID=A0A1J7INH5_9PEZI|nr:hypothetical protein CONLIGDRAFT_390808 [Coniochaeta ligniaria NRRL 30616]
MEEEEASQPARKRHRVAVACDECRRRKIRCDGVQPLCSFCRQQGLTCAYHKGPQRVQVSQDYLESLIRQVHDLKRTSDPLASQNKEETVQAPYDGYMDQHAGDSATESAYSTVSSSMCGPTHQDADRPPSLISLQRTPRGPQVNTMAGSPHVVPALEDALSVTESATDTIVCAGSPPPASGGSYFGASSTPAFLDAVQAMAAPGDGRDHSARARTRARPRTGDKRNAAATHASKKKPSLGIQSLPPRWTADHLVDTYFSHVCITFTVLHEPTFREEYEQLWRPGSRPPEPVRLCVAHAVFALGALFSDRLPAEESESQAENLFVQARELCDLDNLDEGSLATVQALLLMGHYLHVKRDSRCWYIFGLAIRTAQGLGLHLSDINNKYDVVERETRKRCWCGCLVMDAMLAMTFGRPTMILPEYYQNVQLPEPVHDEQVTAVGISPRPATAEGDDGAKPPNILLFIQRVELCVILHGILRTLYEPGKCFGESITLRVREMAELDQQLSAWLARLPPTMRMRKPQEETAQPSSNTNGSVPSHMIHTRYLTVRILLTRPSLVAVACATASNSPEADLDRDALAHLDHSFALCAAQACVDTSKRLIDHIRTDTGLQRRVVGATWYNTNCVFNAALVIFSAHIIPGLQARVSGMGHWQSCIDLMRSFSHNCRSARACLSMLELLNSRLAQSKRNMESQHVEFEEVPSDFSNFTACPPWTAVTEWTESFGFDELLLGGEFGFLQDVVQITDA